MIEVFINERVKNHLREHIWNDADYSFYMRSIKEYLKTFFRKRKQSSKIKDRERVKIASILDGKSLHAMSLAEEHVAENRDFYMTWESVD